MKRNLLILEVWRFTSTAAAAREIVALLENSDYKICAHVKSDREIEELAAELEDCRGHLGRLLVRKVKE